MTTLLLATHNLGKIKDYQALVPSSFTLIAQSELGIQPIEETGLSFIENALLKARHAASFTDHPTLAEDSGLLVEDLKGAPGLYSARYAKPSATDADNREKLLFELSKMPHSARRAYFYCVTVLLRFPHDPAPLVGEGIWPGKILMTPIGEEGFGYLPIFYCSTHQKPAALLSPSLRTQVNHRGHAFRQLISKYENLYA